MEWVAGAKNESEMKDENAVNIIAESTETRESEVKTESDRGDDVNCDVSNGSRYFTAQEASYRLSNSASGVAWNSSC